MERDKFTTKIKRIAFNVLYAKNKNEKENRLRFQNTVQRVKSN